MTHSPERSALVLFSGGQDSTTCLHWALDRYDHVRALSIRYGQRHAVELEAATAIAAKVGVELEVLELPAGVLASTSPLVAHDRPVQGYADAASLPGGIEDTFVPMRNLLFLTLAANRAVAHGCTHVVTGVSQEDFGGYPDCRRVFVDSAEQAAQQAVEGTGHYIHIDTPLVNATKAETVRMAMKLPGCMDSLALSHTCYRGERPGCGECHACLLRAKGFEEAGVADPLFA